MRTFSERPADENLLIYAETKQEIFVQGFEEDMTQETLEEYFGKFGTIVKSKMLPKNERFAGKYWVAFDNAATAAEALASLGEGAQIGGQTIDAKLSEPRTKREPRPDNSKRTIYVGNLSFRVEDW